MKKIINIIVVLTLISCNTKAEKLSTTETFTEEPSSKAIEAVKPCELFGIDQLASVFNIEDKSSIEMYDRTKSNTTKQCQFIWQEKDNAIQGSQIMINITHKSEDMGATFSRMLELDLEKGLSASENGKIIIIKPTPLEGFGDDAYHWEQLSFQNLQKIVFQVQNNYKIEILYNSHNGVNVEPNIIKNKLIQIGKTLNQQL